MNNKYRIIIEASAPIIIIIIRILLNAVRTCLSYNIQTTEVDQHRVSRQNLRKGQLTVFVTKL